MDLYSIKYIYYIGKVNTWMGLTMANNDVIFLNTILDQKKTIYEEYTDSEFFELFCFEQILKEFDLSYDELIFGNVDGGSDGGIDGFFLIVDKEYAGEGFAESISQNASSDEVSDWDPTNNSFQIDRNQFKKNLPLELYIIQSKETPSFAESVFDRIIPTLKDIFDYSKTYEDLSVHYSSNLLEKVFLFRQILVQLSALHPSLKIKFTYATKGDSSSINDHVKNRGNLLKSDLESLFSAAEVEIEYLGARELLNKSRQEQNYTMSLNFMTSYLSVGQDSYILLSKLVDYYKFITEDTEAIRKYLFESNVRDYQGNVEVNIDIRTTLENPESNIDFWWLNNGITILASKASIVGNTINLDDVQIINGLQTTYSIFNYFRNNRDALISDRRLVSIKIIIIDQNSPETRDKIIKATNFQTAIQPYSLRATDQIQRDLEDYFMSKGWFYDRRKNFYKNNGKPVYRIVSIQYLSQAYMSIILRRPQNARSNPVSLIKTTTNYNLIFNNKVNPDVYLFCAKFMKSVETYLRKNSSQEWMIVKYHLGMASLINHFKNLNYQPTDLIDLLRSNTEPLVSDEIFSNTLDQIINLGNDYIHLNDGDFTSITKTKEFTKYLEENIKFEE